MIEQGIFQLVTQAPAVQAAVGIDANGVTRAAWVLMKQGTPVPFLVFSRVGTTNPYTMAGPLGTREALYQIACYAASYYSSREVAKTVIKCLESYTKGGTLPDADATVVKSVMLDKDFDARYEEGDKGFVFTAYLQFRIWYLD
jgi:hypothetical protein